MKKKLYYLMALMLVTTFLQAQNLNLDLEVYLQFQNNLADSSGNTNNPTNFSGSFTSDKFNNSNSALRLNSSNSEYLFIPNNSILNPEYTVSFWARLESIPSNNTQFVITSLGGSTKESGISVTNNYFGYSGWGNYTVTQNNTYGYAVGTVPTGGQWYYITSVRDNNSISLYINGALQSSISATETTLFSGGTVGVYIGKRANNTEFSNITIDEFRIYSRPLSSTEVQNLYSISNSIENIEELAFEVYPIPSNGNISIQLEESSMIKKITLYDMSGKVISVNPIVDETRTKAEFMCTTKGVYFLQITSEDNYTSTRKIIIN